MGERPLSTLSASVKADVDVAVLSCPTQLAPMHPLAASADGLAYGQPVYFLGFPFGWDGGAENINRDFPMPFVKGGDCQRHHRQVTLRRFYIDAHGNKGFSGGPVVFSYLIGRSQKRRSKSQVLLLTIQCRHESLSSINGKTLSSTTTTNQRPFPARILALS